MRFILRHPLVILFAVAALALSYGVYTRLTQESTSGGPGMMRGGMGPVSVTVAVVSRQSFADEVESIGTAQANESVNLTAKVTDTVTAVHFEDGDLVEQGDILVELTNVAEAARLSEVQSELDDARRQYERLQSLIATNLISQTDLEAARTRFATAQARLEGVAANMDDRLIRAPFSGMLGFRNISEGTLVTPSMVITTLDDISTIKLDFNIAEVFFAQLQPGLSVTANSIVYRGRDFEGRVQNIGSRIDEVTRSVQVRAEIDNSDRVLRPGMLLTVGLTLNERDAIVVPEAALIPSQGRQYIFVVDEENTARRVEVEIGRRQPGLAEVVSGVIPGQRVITQGIAQVRPGQAVRIMSTGESSTSAAGTNAGPEDQS